MEALTRLGATDDDDFDILEAALILAVQDHPGVRLGPYRAHFDDITGDAAEYCDGSAAPVQRADALARAIAFNHGYSGDRETYDDPANANLIDVIDRRRGLPVALAVIYLGVARQLDWPACGLNVPGHLVIRVGAPDNFVVQDPFDDGKLIASGALPAAFQAMTAPNARPNIETADALPDRAVLVRMLNNIAGRAEADGDTERALILHGRMTAIAPQYSGLWWERARLERIAGHLTAARTSLIHMLETTHDPALRGRVQGQLASLTRSMN
jgi:regulator of sirC expression with transglutaminase-like and TPR domain